LAKEILALLKESVAKGFYEDKSADSLKEEYIQTVNDAMDQFDFSYFPGTILLNKP
jgi:hypothetical protein